MGINQYLWMIAAMASVLAGCGGGDGNEPAAPVAAQVRLVVPGHWAVMGSSSAQGSGASAGTGWAALLQARVQGAGVSMANLAKGGSVTYEGLSASASPPPNRPQPDLQHNVDAALSGKPSLLLLSYPTNDSALGYTVDETVRNLLAIRGTAQAAGTAVLLLSTQPRNMAPELLARLPAIDAQLASAAGACFVQVREALAGPDGKLAPAYDAGDGVHPNDAGHAVIVAHIQATLDAGQCVRLK
ncbi:GDSL-type esterase/lipase family protein [Cupriavidus sp. MP-37]|uniref:SGNH/GDSL hydrolase family protein n=1 Tax=Cupriavidus sp. MP-37 TaxID=2884455 RepID=UPI001D0B23C7|nr:GDSL-type esterase/lipase family protein [Cupriavidus sp. MP-37]UDM53333.1 GDSL-type esterase/lipase family protein [Cupriavidus sp. MP-37]